MEKATPFFLLGSLGAMLSIKALYICRSLRLKLMLLLYNYVYLQWFHSIYRKEIHLVEDFVALNEAGLGKLLLNDSPQLHNNGLPSESTHRDFFEINELQQGVSK